MIPWSRRLYRLRPLAAMWLSLPFLLLCAWYGWRAFSELDAYRRMEAKPPKWTLELFQLQLYDVLRRDLQGVKMPREGPKSKLPTFQLNIDKENLQTLYLGGEEEEQREYAEARLEYDGNVEKVEVRLRGQRHWHLLGAKKSLKVQLPKGKLYKGHRVFNLIADPTPLVVGEQLLLDYARERGVLTPDAEFAKLRINSADLGVFHYETQPDESLLRNNRRVPGSIYSGDLPTSAPTQALWENSKHWKKVASRTDSEDSKLDHTELDHFLAMVGEGTHEQFADFVRHEVDVERFVHFELLDVAFGGDQHDFRENHRYYFDPYRGRWEPIAWSFRGFQSDPHFNLVENPVTLRLKLSPGYLTRRDQQLYRFLTGDGAPNEVERRGKAMMDEIAPDLLRDPHWSAYRLLSRVDAFHRRMMRPLSLEKAALVFESELTTYRHRHAQLVDALEANPLYVGVEAETGEDAATPKPEAKKQTSTAPSHRYRVNVIVDGRGGAQLIGASAKLDPACLSPAWQLFEAPLTHTDSNLAVATSHSARTPVTPLLNTPHGLLTQPIDLVPGTHLVARTDADPGRGSVRSALRPELYPYTLETSCPLVELQLEAEHLATGARIFSQPATPAQLANILQPALAGDVPKLVAGTQSIHPWRLRRAPLVQVTLGPGVVEVEATRVFEAHENVTIAPGTTLRMAPGASLIIAGRVHFAGNREAQIQVVRAGSEAWGGIALQGPGTQGSQIEHVRILGGSRPAWRQVSFGGMLNVQDTRDVSLRSVEIGENTGDGDLTHVAYTQGLKITDGLLHTAVADGLDLEHATAELQRVTLRGIGDDALDTMGSELKVSDSQVLGCTGNGVSAGEESHVALRSSLVANCSAGVLAKNNSTVDVASSVLFGAGIGVRAYSRTVRYDGKSELFADEVFIVNSSRPIERKDKKHDVLDRGSVHASLPPPGSLSHLRSNVLGLNDWPSLAGRAAMFPAPKGPPRGPEAEEAQP